uniref:Uncharacterized protein n=1 Tax=uncultured prokaryote TaxID=198431 RepID=A0A0H5Q303_9ZZZZ|nr:hypothetical protein [uncultured prokaryote]
MLTLTGTIRATATVGGGVNRKTKEAIPLRNIVQIEALDRRGLLVMTSLTVPDLSPFEGRTGEVVSVPVRAWAAGGVAVSLSYEDAQ